MSATPKRLLFFLLLCLFLWFFLRWGLPICLPFLLGFLLAMAAEPLVYFGNQRLKLPRSVAAGIGVTVTLGILFLLLTMLGAILVRQLRTLVGLAPDLADRAQDGLAALRQWLLALSEKAPESLRPTVQRGVENVFNGSSALVEQVAGKLLSMATGVVSKLPDSALGLATWLLASFMFSAKLPQIRELLRDKLPKNVKEQWIPMLKRMKTALSGWLGAQLKLMGLSFLTLLVGFWLLRIRYAPVWAAIIAFLDALPVLGTGTILVPWGVVCFLQGDTPRALGLLALFGVTALVRTLLEPKLVGKQLGLDPLVTLAAMYAGYRLWGITGMLFAPLLAVVVAQLFTVPDAL